MKHTLCTVKGCLFEGRYCRNHLTMTPVVDKPIAKESKKRGKINRSEYGPAARKFRDANPNCQIKLPGCTGKTQGVHHVRGKASIELLLDQSNWKAACNHCNRTIEKNDAAARQLGLKKSKHAPEFNKLKKNKAA